MQEDAIVVNRSAIQRGLFHSVQWDAYHVKDACYPETDAVAEADGSVAVGTEVRQGGTMCFSKKNGPVRQGNRTPAHVDSVTINNAASVDLEHDSVVRTRQFRVPEAGDKFVSRHGQKGVLSFEVHDEDLPYTEDGLQPDFLINPHAFPSRMTLGQVIEAMSAELGLHLAKRQDATLTWAAYCQSLLGRSIPG